MNDMNREGLLALVTNKTGWTRRDFVTSSLATGFALSVQPVCAQTMIVTDTHGLTAVEVKIPTYSLPSRKAEPSSFRTCPYRANSSIRIYNDARSPRRFQRHS
jgi:carboxymethylenebutenolidase